MPPWETQLIWNFKAIQTGKRVRKCALERVRCGKGRIENSQISVKMRYVLENTLSARFMLHLKEIMFKFERGSEKPKAPPETKPLWLVQSAKNTSPASHVFKGTEKADVCRRNGESAKLLGDPRKKARGEQFSKQPPR